MLRRSGCKNEKIAFIMDESNVLDSGFLERMNTLLANGEVEAANPSLHFNTQKYNSLRSSVCTDIEEAGWGEGQIKIILLLPILSAQSRRDKEKVVTLNRYPLSPLPLVLDTAIKKRVGRKYHTLKFLYT